MITYLQVEIPEIQAPAGILIRRAGPEDSEHLARMSYLIFRELEKAPYWHPTPPEVWAELRKDVHVFGRSHSPGEPGARHRNRPDLDLPGPRASAGLRIR